MKLKRTLIAAAVAALAGTANAQVSDGVVKIGVLNDQSSLYADVGGPGSVVAAKMAVAGSGPSRIRRAACRPSSWPACASPSTTACGWSEWRRMIFK